MTDDRWREFFQICTQVLGRGNRLAEDSETWCAWTTFGSLSTDIIYWTAGLPNAEDLDVGFIKDNGVWGQPFLFKDLAHVIIPKEFLWEKMAIGSYESGIKQQAIEKLSSALAAAGIPHRCTDIVLEVKLY